MIYPEMTPDLKRGFSFSTPNTLEPMRFVTSVTIGSGETLLASQGGAVIWS
ncbi:MAG: hypothetical protein M2R45_01866 [Verrucomicrobia subdivision 3 bacterium]|nr:hypothetical protein [Limisphaerales bacterium]MCS1415666.1 hypothetical protein [Limisphaerales bacterium]